MKLLRKCVVTMALVIGFFLHTVSPVYAAVYLDGVGEVTIADTDISNMSGPRGIFVSGNYAYVAARSGDALDIIDISDPTNPDGVAEFTGDAGLLIWELPVQSLYRATMFLFLLIVLWQLLIYLIHYTLMV